MATNNSTILNRCKTASGVTMVIGECEPSSTSVVVKPGLKFVLAALATYSENPGDVRPPYCSTMTGDEVVFTVTSGMNVTFVIFGCD